MILLTKFKKIIGMMDKFPHSMEIKVSLMDFLTKSKDTLVIFLFEMLPFMMLLGEKDFF